MAELRCTLVADGSSDAALIPLLKWLLVENGVEVGVQIEWADYRPLRQPPQTLAEKMRVSIDLFPCDLLFVHRDAERITREERVNEIRAAIAGAHLRPLPQHICVVPVRMTEAWLLFDELAIRHAAGNRTGRELLNLPRLSDVESLPDPKTLLHNSLRTASGLKGRRLKRFAVQARVHRLSELIHSFAPLRELTAFTALETEIQSLIHQMDKSAANSTNPNSDIL